MLQQRCIEVRGGTFLGGGNLVSTVTTCILQIQKGARLKPSEVVGKYCELKNRGSSEGNSYSSAPDCCHVGTGSVLKDLLTLQVKPKMWT